MSDPDPERLRELGAKLDAVHQREATRREQPPPTPSGIILRLSTELVVAPLLGGAIGLGLDWLFSTRPILTVIVFLLGAVTGIRNVMLTARELNAQAQGRANDNRE
jgi:ATP synthase protein I